MKFKAVAALVAGALSLWLCGGAAAQNAVCPTMAAADNSNACASTAFVQGAVGGGSALPSTSPGQVLGNGTGVAAPAAASNLSPVIDQAFGSTRGSILERGAASWGIIPPGTSGLPYVSNGAGADPGYQALTAAGIAAATITSTQIAAGTITGSNIASATVANSNLAAVGTTADWEADTAGKLMTTDQIWGAGAFPTITFGATTTIDLSTLVNGTITLTANITTLNWNNCKAGQTGVIEFIQDATGSRTVPAAWNSSFRWAGGTRGVLSTAANAVDWLFYQCKSASIAFVSLQKGLAN